MLSITVYGNLRYVPFLVQERVMAFDRIYLESANLDTLCQSGYTTILVPQNYKFTK